MPGTLRNAKDLLGYSIRATDGTIGTIAGFYGGWIDVSSVAWAGKSAHRLVQSTCDTKDAWNHGPLMPTPGAGPP